MVHARRARPQRRRQDDVDPGADDARPAERRTCRGGWFRRRRRRRAGLSPHRSHRPVRRSRRVPHGPGEPRIRRPSDRTRPPRPCAVRRTDRPARSRRTGRPAGWGAVRRITAAHRSRRQPRRLPFGAVSRRTDDGTRPDRPTRPVGRRRRADRIRHHRGPDDAVPRGGRPSRRRHCRARPRPDRCQGHPGRAEAAHWRQGRHRHGSRCAGRPPAAHPDRRRPAGPEHVTVTYNVSQAEDAGALVAHLGQVGITICELDVTSPSLDDVFTYLTPIGART